MSNLFNCRFQLFFIFFSHQLFFTNCRVVMSWIKLVSFMENFCLLMPLKNNKITLIEFWVHEVYLQLVFLLNILNVVAYSDQFGQKIELLLKFYP